MFLLSQGLIQFSIVLGVVVLFLVTYIINKKTKAPKGVEIPEKCHSCPTETCIVKFNEIDKLKEELKKELEKCDKESREK